MPISPVELILVCLVQSTTVLDMTVYCMLTCPIPPQSCWKGSQCTDGASRLEDENG